MIYLAVKFGWLASLTQVCLYFMSIPVKCIRLYKQTFNLFTWKSQVTPETQENTKSEQKNLRSLLLGKESQLNGQCLLPTPINEPKTNLIILLCNVRDIFLKKYSASEMFPIVLKKCFRPDMQV